MDLARPRPLASDRVCQPEVEIAKTRFPLFEFMRDLPAATNVWRNEVSRHDELRLESRRPAEMQMVMKSATS